jgi:GntR family transcriptional regulator, N-acetylglucosamine utilization regulator
VTNSTLPKYYRIVQDITARIQSGKLRPGMRVPSENEIIQHHRVSNTTARKALREIEQAGWAIRIKGRGTFVQTQNVQRSATRILGFTRNMIEAGHQPRTEVLEADICRKGYSAVVNGRFYHMNGPIFRIKRLRLADEVPMMLEERFISLELCPDIGERDLEQSLYDLYERQYGLTLTEVNQMLSTLSIRDEATMGLFRIAEPICAFMVDGATFCGKELILEMEKSIYRGDIYRFSVRAT